MPPSRCQLDVVAGRSLTGCPEGPLAHPEGARQVVIAAVWLPARYPSAGMRHARRAGAPARATRMLRRGQALQVLLADEVHVQVVVRHLEVRVPVRLEADIEVVERGQAALSQRRLEDRVRLPRF